ncbi:MAG TPA: hypothetical protein VF796_01005 [Humisphaera sp.]
MKPLAAPLAAAAVAAALLLPLSPARADAPATRPADAEKAERKPEAKAGEPKQGESKPAEHKQSPGDKLSVTEGEVTIAGTAVKYRATAGTYQLKDDGGKPKADLYFTAYERTPVAASLDDAAKRPVTFVFNGGPGAASVWLHIGTAGPKRVKLTPAGEAPPPPYRVVDNEFSWLDATDLVFIDPVGTGYSRAAPGEDPKQFYGVDEDVRWVAEFIRLWTTRNQRWPSPKFLAGESYGTTRAAALSEHLLQQQGIALNGVILISTVLDFATLRAGGGNELPYVVFLPTYTATAHHHKRLPADLQADLGKALKEAQAFADDKYPALLAKGASLTQAERDEAAKTIARLTGLPADVVAQAKLRVDPDLFRKALLKDQGVVVGRFDARLTGFDPDPLDRNPDHDPSFNQFFAAYAGAYNDYARRTLKYESDLSYDVLSGRVQPWNFGRAGNGYLNVSDNLARAMRLAPRTKLMVCAGVTDLATPYWAVQHTLRHMDLSPELRRNVTERFYAGGHMLYHEAEGLKQLKADIAAFVADATKSAEPAK